MLAAIPDRGACDKGLECFWVAKSFETDLDAIFHNHHLDSKGEGIRDTSGTFVHRQMCCVQGVDIYKVARYFKGRLLIHCSSLHRSSLHTRKDGEAQPN